MLALMDKGMIAAGAVTFYFVLCIIIYFFVKVFPRWDERQRERQARSKTPPKD